MFLKNRQLIEMCPSEQSATFIKVSRWGILFLICILTLTLSVANSAVTEISIGEGNEFETFNAVETTTIRNSSEEEADTKKTEDHKPFLLPQALKPIHYRLDIIPLLFQVDDDLSPYYNTSRFSAPGKVWITLECLEDASNITLHAHKDIKIIEKSITVTNSKANQIVPIGNVSRENETDFLLLHLSQNITKSSDHTYVVFIEFISKIADDRLNGLYLDYYIEPATKEKRYLSTTLFALNHARKAFPCWDEPRFKANFSVSIGRKDNSGYTSISNMPLSSTKPMKEATGWVWDIFEETLPLPTYLVALITTDFPFRSVKHANIEVRLHAPAFLLERTNQLNLTSDKALQKTQNPYLLLDPIVFIESALKIFEDTGLGSYPLPKLDVVALPHFFFNAMENMGATTFKYPVILNIENTTTASELLKMNYVAGHEIVHQWFGNMLTPKSWTYVWLKESFSDLFSRIFISEKLYNTFNNEDFVTSELQKALEYDSGPDTHPLENHIKSSASVGEIYTHIPYQKGASIMHMTRFFMGEKSFKRGLESLFLEKKYSNIDQYDLFNHLQEAQKLNRILTSQGLDENTTVTDILNTWTQQTGYPVVRVRRDVLGIILKQEKLINGLLKLLSEKEADETTTTARSAQLDDKIEDDNKYWWIPVNVYDAGSKKTHVRWMAPNETETVVLVGKHSRISNVEGYFRILYSKEELLSNLKELTRAAHLSKYVGFWHNFGLEGSSRFKSVETSQLLDDYFSFAFSKYEEVPMSLLFHVISTILPDERSYVVWNTFLTNMKKPYRLLRNTEFFPSLQEFLTRLLGPVHAFLQSEITSVQTAPCTFAPALTRKIKFAQFYALVFAWLCRLGAEECKFSSAKAASDFMKTGDISIIDTDTQESLLCTAVRTACESNTTQHDTFWTFLEKSYFTEFYPVQRDRYLKALSCTTERRYLERLLTWTTNDTLDFHDIDRVTVLKYVIANPAGRELIMEFLDNNFQTLYKSASVANPVTEGLKAFVEYVNSKEKLQELEDFIDKHAEAMEKKKRFLKKQIRSAKLNVLWMDLFAEEIGKNADSYVKNALVIGSRFTCTQETDPDFENYLTRITDWK